MHIIRHSRTTNRSNSVDNQARNHHGASYVGDVRPLGDVGRLAVLADVHVRRAVPGVDWAMVLRFANPVEEQVVLDRVAVAERIV